MRPISLQARPSCHSCLDTSWTTCMWWCPSTATPASTRTLSDSRVWWLVSGYSRRWQLRPRRFDLAHCHLMSLETLLCRHPSVLRPLHEPSLPWSAGCRTRRRPSATGQVSWHALPRDRRRSKSRALVVSQGWLRLSALLLSYRSCGWPILSTGAWFYSSLFGNGGRLHRSCLLYAPK